MRSKVSESSRLQVTRTTEWNMTFSLKYLVARFTDGGAWTHLLVTLTTRRVDGVPQLGVLPLAQLVLLGPGSSFRGLDLWTSDTGNRPEGDRKSARDQQR